VVEALKAHPTADWLCGGKQADPETCDDHVLDEIETVRTVRDTRLKSGERANDADHLVVRGVT